MLQDGSHLNLETVSETLFGADVMQRQIAEGVYFQELSLVYGILPVYVEKTVYGRCHLVHILAVIGNDAEPHDVRDIGQRFILGALELQLSGQGILRLYPRLDAGDNDAGLV